MTRLPRIAGRYEVHDAIAAGGMATVHLGRLRGQAGFSRIVAIKQLRGGFDESPELVSTLLDEARLASRIQHPNVVATLDVVAEDQELLIVLEYVHGESLSRLLSACQRAGEPVSPSIVAAIAIGMLDGLHAAHEATSATGEPLGIVHRDVSPQNVIVGVDGHARVLDFGVAKARGRLQSTREGQLKGKLAYMAPEQVRQGLVSRRSDVFAAGIVFWEALTGARLFAGDNEGHVLSNVLGALVVPPSEKRPELDRALDDIALRALDRDPERRYATAHDFARAIEARVDVAPPSEVGRWVSRMAEESLKKRTERVKALELGTGTDVTPSAASEEPTRTATVQSAEPRIDAPPRRSRIGWIFAAGIAAFAIGALSLAFRGPPAGPEAGTTSEAPEPTVDTPGDEPGGPPVREERASQPMPSQLAPKDEATLADPPGGDPATSPSASSATPAASTTAPGAAAAPGFKPPAAPPVKPPPPPAAPEPSAKPSPFYRFE